MNQVMPTRALHLLMSTNVIVLYPHLRLEHLMMQRRSDYQYTASLTVVRYTRHRRKEGYKTVSFVHDLLAPVSAPTRGVGVAIASLVEVPTMPSRIGFSNPDGVSDGDGASWTALKPRGCSRGRETHPYPRWELPFSVLP